MNKQLLLSSVALIAAFASADTPKVGSATITVSGYAGGSTALTDFPLLVKISEAKFPGLYGTAAADGSDLRFYSGDKEVPHEIEKWDSAGSSFVWVKVPSLSGTNTRLTMKWGGTAARTTENAEVWSRYRAVWHMNTEGTVQLDATGNGYNMTNSTSATSATRTFADADLHPYKVGNGICYNTAGYKLFGRRVISATSTTPTAYSVSGWYEMKDCSTTSTSVGIYSENAWVDNNNSYGLCLKYTGTFTANTLQMLYCFGAVNTKFETLGNYTVDRTKWHHYCFTYNKKAVTLYIDGAQKGSKTLTKAVDYTKATASFGTAMVNTKLDESRVIMSASSEAWIKADYATQNNPDGFITVSGIALPGEAAVPTAVSGLVYNGAEQTGVFESEAYTLTGNAATDAGTYTATATLTAGYTWIGGATHPTNVTWSIARAANNWTVSPSMNPTFFAEGTTDVVISLGAPAHGEPVANYTASDISELTKGSYELKVTVEPANYAWITNTIAFKIYGSGDAPADGIVRADCENGDDAYEGADIGSAAHPYKTLRAAHIAATNLIATTGNPVLIELSEGRYDLSTQLLFVAGESIVGKGKDKTFVNVAPFTTGGYDSIIKLVSANNLLSSLCVTGNVGKTYKDGNVYDVTKTIWVANGTVDRCRSAYNKSSSNFAFGSGIYLVDGTVRYCEIDHNTGDAMYTRGAGAYVAGGTMTDCDIHHNTGKTARDGLGHALHIGGGTVRRCRIYSNGLEVRSDFNGDAGAVYISKGTLENSLIYGNRTRSASNGGGIHNVGGTVRYCTIFNNTAVNDVTCVSGYVQTKGEALNNIIFGNKTAGAYVSGGTCRTNLLDAAVSGYSLNFVTDDPLFADAANGDFHIASAASAAVGKALPITSVVADFEKTVRDASAPTIGAYEFVAQGEDFSTDIRVVQQEWRIGSAPSVELIVQGVPKGEESNVKVTWYLDGTEQPQLADSLNPVFAGAMLGYHTVKAIATYKGDSDESEVVDAFTVLPTTVFVNKTGNGAYPFATPETGTNNLGAALGAVYKTTLETTYVDVDEGTYQLDSIVNLSSSVAVTGRADRTVLCGFRTGNRLLTVDSDGAVVRTLTVSNATYGGAIVIKRGMVDACRVVNCSNTCYGERGAGVRLDGGKLINSEIADCTTYSYTALGGGIAVVGENAVVSNCTVRHCVSAADRAPDEHGGGGIYVGNGLVTHCRIVGCYSSSYYYACAAALRLAGGKVRNCLIADNTSAYGNAVLCEGGTMDNCTIANNTAPAGALPVQLVKRNNVAAPVVRNCVLWNKGEDVSIGTECSVTYSCYANATEGANGNTAQNPRLRSAERDYAIRSSGPCFRTGQVLAWMNAGATDLNGRPRTTAVGGEERVDMGCHQVPNDPGLVIFFQ